MKAEIHHTEDYFRTCSQPKKSKERQSIGMKAITWVKMLAGYEYGIDHEASGTNVNERQGRRTMRWRASTCLVCDANRRGVVSGMLPSPFATTT